MRLVAVRPASVRLQVVALRVLEVAAVLGKAKLAALPWAERRSFVLAR